MNVSNVTQVHGVSPEQLSKIIKEIFKIEFEKISNEIQPVRIKKYLTRKEVSEMLNVNLSTIHIWCKQGRLKPLGIGKRVLFLAEDIDKAIVKL